MTSNSNYLRQEAARHGLLAKAMLDAAPTDPVANERAEFHAREGERLIAQAKVLDEGSSVADTGWRGIDDRHRAPRLDQDSLPRLAPDQKMRDYLGLGRVAEDAITGWLGHQVKAQVAPVDHVETARWNRHIGLGEKDMSTTTLGAGGALVPTVLSAYLIDLMRNEVVATRAGARVVPMPTKTVQVPRLSGDPTSAWLAEAATVTASDAALEQVSLVAKRNEVGPVKISHELSEDSDPVGIGRAVAHAIARAAALKVDQAVLRGSGVDPEPRGILNQTGVTLHAPGTNGDALNYDLLLALVRAVRAANAEPTALVMTPGADVTLSGLKDGQSRYLDPPLALRDLPRLTTNSLPSNKMKGTGVALTEVYAGDFRQALIGVRTALSLQTMTELYRATGQIGIIARFRADVALEHGNAFAVATHVDD